MTTYMLWQMTHKRPVLDEIIHAAGYYERKYGERPDRVEMNPEEAPSPAPDGFLIETGRHVLKRHFLIGKELESEDY